MTWSSNSSISTVLGTPLGRVASVDMVAARTQLALYTLGVIFEMLPHVYIENAEDVGGREDASFVVANSETTTTGRGSAKRDVYDRPCRLRMSYNSLATPLAIWSSELNLGKI